MWHKVWYDQTEEKLWYTSHTTVYNACSLMHRLQKYKLMLFLFQTKQVYGQM